MDGSPRSRDEEWADFTARLADVLGELAERDPLDAVLIISDRAEPSRYVQFSCGAQTDGIWAEAAGDKHVPKDRRYSRADRKLLRASGWEKPRGGNPNWSCGRLAESAGHPAQRSLRLAQVSGELAGMSVLVLHDIMRVAAPDGLGYAAFVQETGEPIVLDRLGLPRESPGPESGDT